jgi:transposase-like protein
MVLHLPERWAKAYETGETNSSEIAREVGSTPQTVLQALRRQGVSTRPRGRPRTTALRLPEHWLRAYEAGEASSIDIAREVGSTPATVLKALRRGGVSIRSAGGTSANQRRLVQPPEHLVEAYREGRMRPSEIAKVLGCSPSVLCHAMRRLGVDRSGYRRRLDERNRTIIAAYRGGETLTQLAHRFQLTRQRVFQIVQ